jgi:hypothetical protein
MQRTHYVERLEEYNKKFNEIYDELKKENEKLRKTGLEKDAVYSCPNPPTILETASDIFMDVFNIKDEKSFDKEEYRNGIDIKITKGIKTGSGIIVDYIIPYPKWLSPTYRMREGFARFAAKWKKKNITKK